MEVTYGDENDSCDNVTEESTETEVERSEVEKLELNMMNTESIVLMPEVSGSGVGISEKTSPEDTVSTLETIPGDVAVGASTEALDIEEGWVSTDLLEVMILWLSSCKYGDVVEVGEDMLSSSCVDKAS